MYTTLDMGFDRNYVQRFLVEIYTENKVRINGITYYHYLPSLTPTGKVPSRVKNRYLNANEVEVRPGQNLTSIARDAKTTVAQIKALNNIGDNIHPGDILRVY